MPGFSRVAGTGGVDTAQASPATIKLDDVSRSSATYSGRQPDVYRVTVTKAHHSGANVSMLDRFARSTWKGANAQPLLSRCSESKMRGRPRRNAESIAIRLAKRKLRFAVVRQKRARRASQRSDT